MQRAYRTPAPRKPSPAIAIPQPVIRRPTSYLTWAVLSSVLVVGLFIVAALALGLGVMVIYGSGRILPGVSVGDLWLGGLSADDAAAQLDSRWSQITVRDGERTWTIPAAQLGLTLDSHATALAAQSYGRSTGSFLSALVGQESVAPVLNVDSAAATQGVKALMTTVERPAANATIRMVNGQLTPVDAVTGRLLNVSATVNRLLASPDGELANGALDLVMDTQAPTVTDATPLLEKARALLASPLNVNAYDPITNQTTTWSVAPDQWGQWLTTENTPTGLNLSLDSNGLSAYLNGQNNSLTDGRNVDVAKSVEAIRVAVAAGRASAMVRVYHKPTPYVVQPGDTLGTLSWKFGFPMFRLVRANPSINMEALSVGQRITIPSKDDLLPLPIVYNKRIVVSISKQRMWVYENGQVKWDWSASTGIADSPTLPGVFQIQSHEKSAYAGNWNLWMPYFMGIYDAVPGFTNGLHGFPARDGYTILWESSLGRPVTYGCILLSTKNEEALYNWAEDGVVIEIQR